jgi:ribose 1,5-bisphosphokinase
MSWLGRVLGDGRRIGPGRFVAVVGPSGAGKDTLIDHVRRACGDGSEVVFPRRVVTRPSSTAEDHDSLSAEAFDRAVDGGAFALHWEAHGLKYGIPVSADEDIRAGRIVVCNVSRTVIGRIRERYAHSTITLVTAPASILLERLAARGRATDGNVAERVHRQITDDGRMQPDAVIENVGPVEHAGKRLLDVVLGRDVVIAVR